MENLCELLFGSPEVSSPALDALVDSEGAYIRIGDRRVVRLVIALHEIDVWCKEAGTFSDQQLEELIGEAILACGFTSPAEALSALVPFLEAIGSPHCQDS